MTNLAELESADHTLARHCAEQTWKDYGDGAIPVNLVLILERLSVMHFSAADLPAAVRGFCTELAPGEGGIAYKPDASYLSRRWTVAHELGHWCLGHVSTFGSPTSSLPFNQEREADAFAGALLIPPSDLRKFAKANKPTIQRIEERYRVTKNIASIAIMKAGVLNHISA